MVIVGGMAKRREASLQVGAERLGRVDWKSQRKKSGEV